MKKYIDCDGVILDTEDGLLDAYPYLKSQNPNLQKKQYLEELNWYLWLRKANVLADAINILKFYAPSDADILTKVFSLNEAREKIIYFRELEVKNNIIIVPAEMKKSDVVDARNNILVDDSIKNLDDWQQNGGISLYFGNRETEYQKIRTLTEVMEMK